VKWFDVGRGYGFIIPDNGMQDILLHLSCLKRDGFEAPLEGARISCEVVERQKGYQCLRVSRSTCRPPFTPSNAAAAPTHSDAQHRLGACEGEVVQPRARLRLRV
jgi:cold shock CspA family protein